MELEALARQRLRSMESAPGIIATTLRDAIFRGIVPSGAPLKQSEIAAQFGVSPIPVREALQRLVAQGLVEMRPNRSVIVTPLSEADFVDIIELRLILEPQALRRSAPNLTAKDLQAAESLLRQVRGQVGATEHTRVHWEFHRCLYAKAQRPRLLAQIDNLYVNINRYVMPAWGAVGVSRTWPQSHTLIVRALRNGDHERAVTLVMDQIKEAADRVVKHLRTSNAK